MGHTDERQEIENPAILLDEIEAARTALEEIARCARKTFQGNGSNITLIDLACIIYETRQLRSRFFGNRFSGETAYDMMLFLYCELEKPRKTSVTGLAYASGCSATTGLRRIDWLVSNGLLEKELDPHDARRTWVELSEKGLAQVGAYLEAFRNRVA